MREDECDERRMPLQNLFMHLYLGIPFHCIRRHRCHSTLCIFPPYFGRKAGCGSREKVFGQLPNEHSRLLGGECRMHSNTTNHGPGLGAS